MNLSWKSAIQLEVDQFRKLFKTAGSNPRNPSGERLHQANPRRGYLMALGRKNCEYGNYGRYAEGGGEQT